MHLNAEEFVDLAEGTRQESSAPHLASCAACSGHLAEMRAMMSAAAHVELPEPSPLFWDHLSRRVHEAIAAEPEPRRSWTDVLAWPRVVMALGALAAVALVVLLVNSRTPTHVVAPAASPEIASARPASDVLAEPSDATDPSLALVGELASDMDWDAAGEAGLTARGSAEHAVTHLNNADLKALQKLLTAELAHSGA
jgi:hypothetical protein